MRIYLDTCCLNRPFDDQSQDRVRSEAAVVRRILAEVAAGSHTLIVSGPLRSEVAAMPVRSRREGIERMLELAGEDVRPTESELQRSEDLQEIGFRPVDALHIACAETGAAEVLLTTDDRLQRCARRHRQRLRVAVMNPVEWK